MSTKSKSTPSKAQSAETKLIKELAKILQDTDLSEIEMEKGSLRLRVARQSHTVTHSAPVAIAAPVAPPAPTAAQASKPKEAAPVTKESAATHPGAVKSPMVGTAYTRSSPEADMFVKLGDQVKAGDTILLVEAMKTFNPITAPKAGKITEILVNDAQPVEFGEVLFIIE